MKTLHLFLFGVLLAFAAIFTTTESVNAQKGGGGKGGGGPARSPAAVGRPGPAPGGINPGRINPGGVGGGFYGPGYSNQFYRNSGIGIGIGVGVGFASPIYGYSSLGYDPYLVPRYSYYPSTAAYLPQPAPLAAAPAPAIAADAAQVRVLVPDPQAKVWFDGAPTSSTGVDRLYHTPALSEATGTTYRIRASWLDKGQEVIQEQVVDVTPGRVSVVDFTRPVVDDGAPPPPSK